MNTNNMKRILLKISGEAFQWSSDRWLDLNAARKVAILIQEIRDQGKEIAIVVWGGNIYRGSKLIESGLNSADSHNMSVLSTVFNAMVLKNVLAEINIESVVLDALHIEFLEKYTSFGGKKQLQKWKVLILSSWIGIPYFSTDTASVIRALELQCEAIIKLTKVDGVYDKDPLKYTDAKKYDELSYDKFLQKDLKVFDQTGIILARDNTLPIFVTKLDDMKALRDIIFWEKAGTKIF